MKILLFFVLTTCIAPRAFAQHAHLHVDSRWKECSFQLDPLLTQQQWRGFTREAGQVAYFRPLIDAKPMGKGKFEISLLRWATAIDDSQPQWNNTFVHPDSTHWLKEGPRLNIPGLTVRIGLTEKFNVALYWTKSPGANYGFWGGQLQYSFINIIKKNWSAAARINFVSIYGPEDLNFNINGLDVLASREYKLYSTWASIAPYAGISTYVSHAHETTPKVSLHDEVVVGAQGFIGAVLKLSAARIAAEYNLGKLNTVSVRLGITF